MWAYRPPTAPTQHRPFQAPGAPTRGPGEPPVASARPRATPVCRLWKDPNARFALRDGVSKANYIEFNIRRTRKSPPLRFYPGQCIQVMCGATEYSVVVFSFTPRSSSGSVVTASGTLRVHHHAAVRWELEREAAANPAKPRGTHA
jgi:hypothetical protein